MTAYRTNTHISNIRYNALPRIESKLGAETRHINPILEIISRHGVNLGLHHLHRHGKIPAESIRLEKDYSVPSGKQNTATMIQDVNPNKIHAVMFKIQTCEQKLIPFEFGEGLSPVHESAVGQDFLQEILSYFRDYKLSNVFALQTLDGQPREECTAEVEVNDYDTIVLPKSMVTAEEFVPTGWSGPPTEDGDPPAGESWAKKTDGSHKVFVS
jgi:hypothetical protein